MDDFDAKAEQLIGSIRLGYEAESEDPNFAFEVPSEDEVAWLARWLVSEGWVRDPEWTNRRG